MSMDTKAFCELCEIVKSAHKFQADKKAVIWVLKAIIDKCNEYPNEIASLQILALLKNWAKLIKQTNLQPKPL